MLLASVVSGVFRPSCFRHPVYYRLILDTLFLHLRIVKTPRYHTPVKTFITAKTFITHGLATKNSFRQFQFSCTCSKIKRENTHPIIRKNFCELMGLLLILFSARTKTLPHSSDRGYWQKIFLILSKFFPIPTPVIFFLSTT